MKKRILFFFITFLIAAIILYFVFKKIDIRETWKTFLSFSKEGIFLVFILTILAVFLGAWRWKIILKDIGYNIPLKNLISSWASGFGIAYFTSLSAMWGDEVFKTYKLKNKFSVSLKKAAVSVFIEDPILDGSIFYLTLIIGVIFFILKTMTIPLELRFVLLIVLFPTIGLILFYLIVFKNYKLNILDKLLKRFVNSEIADNIASIREEIFNFFRPSNKRMWQTVILSFLKGVVNIIRSWVIIFFLGAKVNFITAVSISAFTNIAYTFPLPAALGSLEALQAFAFSRLGLTSRIAVAFVLVLRIADISLALIGIFLVLKFSTKWLKEKMGL